MSASRGQAGLQGSEVKAEPPASRLSGGTSRHWLPALLTDVVLRTVNLGFLNTGPVILPTILLTEIDLAKEYTLLSRLGFTAFPKGKCISKYTGLWECE